MWNALVDVVEAQLQHLQLLLCVGGSLGGRRRGLLLELGNLSNELLAPELHLRQLLLEQLVVVVQAWHGGQHANIAQVAEEVALLH